MLRVLAPWVAGLFGAAVFLRPLADGFGRQLLAKVFWYDALINLGALASLHEALTTGLSGRGVLDWLYSSREFFPQPRPLVTSESLPLAGLLTWPVFDNVVLAHNALLAAGLVLNVVAGASFARALGAKRLASVVAGVGFAFSSYMTFSAGRVQLVFAFPLAFALASTVRFARDGHTRDAVIASAWTLAQALLCLYYALFLAFALPVVALAARCSSPRPRAVRDFSVLGASLLAAAIPAGYLLWPYRELKSRLGLARPWNELLALRGDVRQFFWADADTIWGSLLKDLHRWDSAHFTGFAILGGALVATWLWARSSRQRLVAVAIVFAAAALSPLRLFPLFLIAGIAVLVWLVREARAGRSSAAAPILGALAFLGLFLFLGPHPRAWDVSLGWSPYGWMYEHVPFVDGLRVARRGSLLIQLALGAAAAIAISRLESRRFGTALVLGIAGLVALEGLPIRGEAKEVPTSCNDPAFLAARDAGAEVVGQLLGDGTPHDVLARLRFEAQLCRLSTNAGVAGFVPPLTQLVDDALASLPAPAAHAWLWELGFHHVIVRATGRRPARIDVTRLAPITAAVVHLERDVLVTLKPPGVPPLHPASIDGPLVPVRTAQCDRGVNCPALIDGDPATRWTSSARMSGTETISLAFDRARITGLRWRADGMPTDVPRGLRIESRGPDGTWEPWIDAPALALEGIGRDAIDMALAVPLPPRETTGLRVVQTGTSSAYWLSASALEVVGDR